MYAYWWQSDSKFSISICAELLGYLMTTVFYVDPMFWGKMEHKQGSIEYQKG